jgi:tetratricopeptide (TPR) repeat protein
MRMKLVSEHAEFYGFFLNHSLDFHPIAFTLKQHGLLSMKIWNLQPKRIGLLFAATALFGAAPLALVSAPAYAANILQEQGAIEPSYGEYTFAGQEGQAVTIMLSSDDFDTVLTLVDPTGMEIAWNDDYGRSLNSTIIMTLPADGTYKVLARSYSGAGGRYNLVVRPATDYEQAYSNASMLAMNGSYDEAIAAFDTLIGSNPNEPEAYLGRADARWGQFYATANPELPSAPSPETQAAIIADYQSAADLYEQAGNMDAAQSLREQISYMQDPMPGE